MIKLSNLKDDEWISVEGEVLEFGEIKDDLKTLVGKKIYTTKQIKPTFDARKIIENAVEDFYVSGNMYEDWDEDFLASMTERDIQDVQDIINKIIERDPSQNVAYQEWEEIENDLLEELDNE